MNEKVATTFSSCCLIMFFSTGLMLGSCNQPALVVPQPIESVCKSPSAGLTSGHNHRYALVYDATGLLARDFFDLRFDLGGANTGGEVVSEMEGEKPFNVLLEEIQASQSRIVLNILRFRPAEQLLEGKSKRVFELFDVQQADVGVFIITATKTEHDVTWDVLQELAESRVPIRREPLE